MSPIPFRVRLVDDLRDPLHRPTLHLSAALAAIVGVGPVLVQTWHEIPDEWKALLPAGWAHWIASGGLVLIALGHFLQLERIIKPDAPTQGDGNDAQ